MVEQAVPLLPGQLAERLLDAEWIEGQIGSEAADSSRRNKIETDRDIARWQSCL